jgi:hypothetical protein
VLFGEVMSEELICPDCGGVIGAEPGSGRTPCRCFEKRQTTAVAPVPAPTEPLVPSGPEPSSSGEKICRSCGKNLKGHRRLKDSRGYICVKCAEAEEAANDDPSLIPCPECARKLKIEGMTTYQGNVMCKRCAADMKELHKYKSPPPGLVNHKEFEKASLQKQLLYAGILLVIIAAAYFGIIGSR